MTMNWNLKSQKLHMNFYLMDTSSFISALYFIIILQQKLFKKLEQPQLSNGTKRYSIYLH